LRDDAARPASDILLEAVHGGLRLQAGYMTRHFEALCERIACDDRAGYQTYAGALADSFGRAYVDHLEAWLRAEGRTPLETASSIEAERLFSPLSRRA
jgi:hypothetical protein